VTVRVTKKVVLDGALETQSLLPADEEDPAMVPSRQLAVCDASWFRLAILYLRNDIADGSTACIDQIGLHIGM
jgi:hypothetical protein